MLVDVVIGMVIDPEHSGTADRLDQVEIADGCGNVCILLSLMRDLFQMGDDRIVFFRR